MGTTYVELQEIPVLRVRADMKGKGPSSAFNLLESKLSTIKGRKFYGTFQPTPDGEEYYACVARINSDDPEKNATGDRGDPGGMVCSSQVSGVGEEPLQATRYLRGNGPYSRRGLRAPLDRVLPKPSRTPTLPACADSSSNRGGLSKPQGLGMQRPWKAFLRTCNKEHTPINSQNTKFKPRPLAPLKGPPRKL